MDPSDLKQILATVERTMERIQEAQDKRTERQPIGGIVFRVPGDELARLFSERAAGEEDEAVKESFSWRARFIDTRREYMLGEHDLMPLLLPPRRLPPAGPMLLRPPMLPPEQIILARDDLNQMLAQARREALEEHLASVAKALGEDGRP